MYLSLNKLNKSDKCQARKTLNSSSWNFDNKLLGIYDGYLVIICRLASMLSDVYFNLFVVFYRSA